MNQTTTDTTNEWFAPNVGLVQSTDSNSKLTFELTSFRNANFHLGSCLAGNTAAGDKMNPARP